MIHYSPYICRYFLVIISLNIDIIRLRMSTPKKIVIIIAFNRFQDKEYTPPKQIFSKAGILVTTASTQLGLATGKLGEKEKVDITLDQVKVSDYDAILFIGGPGSFDLYDNPTCHQIAQDTIHQGKILAALSAAPGIIANAGVLKGKKATMFEDTGILAQNGATYTGNDVEIDGRIITATGPDTAKAWAEAILEALK